MFKYACLIEVQNIISLGLPMNVSMALELVEQKVLTISTTYYQKIG